MWFLRVQVQTFTGMKEGAAIQYFFEAQIKVTKLKTPLLGNTPKIHISECLNWNEQAVAPLYSLINDF